jgi:peptidoglycan/LPS O-acetylase OafA/YrhL
MISDMITLKAKKNIAGDIRRSTGKFNFIRILAATFVIFSHSYALTGNMDPGCCGETIGGFGVLAFFAISGFLLINSSDFSIFYFWRRGLRIFPALIVVVFLTVLFLGPLVTSLRFNEYFSSMETWSYLIHLGLLRYTLPGVFTDNPYPSAVNGSLWMLPHLFILYIILFLLVNLKLTSKRYILFLYFIGFAMLISQPIVYAIVHTSIKSIMHLATSNAIVSIDVVSAASCNIFSVFRTDILLIGDILLSTYFYYFYLSFFGGILLALYRDSIKFNYKEAFMLLLTASIVNAIVPSLNTYILVIVVPYFVIKLALTKNDILNYFETLGDFSYGMYIYAFPVQQAIAYYAENDLTPLKMFSLALPITIFFAVASWYIIELPIQKFKNWRQRPP